MIVYGDQARRAAPRPELLAVAAMLDAEGPSIDAFVDAAGLVQGIVDAEFHARGEIDARSPLADALMMALTRLAGCVLDGSRPHADAWREVAGRPLPEAVSVKLAEGFAFYALDPRAFATAARRAGLSADVQVIGARSIGVALAAVTAAAVGAPPPVTVRPVGHPFARRLALAPSLREELRSFRGRVAVADEGPGLSGSSFLAVADALAEAGVDRDRLVLLPSHGEGPGSQASERARTLFRDAAVHPPPSASPAEIAAGAADLIGSAEAPAEEVGGGAWRLRLYGAEADWPAAAPHWERRKLLVRAAAGDRLLKWAGFGSDARGKLARARTLSEAGLSPPVIGLRNGWLAAPWVEGRPLGRSDHAPLAQIAASLRLRAHALPAGDEEGASDAALVEMVRVNVGEAMGEAAGRAAASAAASGLSRPAGRRVVIDGRLHRHEWLRTPDGRILKTDALDHARGHDLIGAQEIGWDVAGAAVEWSLDEAQVGRLAEAAGADTRRLPALTLAYLAFHMGAAHMAAELQPPACAEATRLRRDVDRYAHGLQARLELTP